MHSIVTLTVLSTVGIFGLPTFALPAADPSTSSWIVDPAAVTAAPAVPFIGEILVSDLGLDDSTGQATVLNNCNFDVFVYACSQNPANCTGESTIAANGGTFDETYLDASTLGRSIKIGTTAGETDKPILQFEYTNNGNGSVFYDLSEVNGNPFGEFGFALTSDNPACFQAECPAPSTHDVCPFVFTDPTNGTVSNCPIGSSTGVTLCG